MPIYVEYKVPVLVEIDLEEEAVVGVCVDDERVEGPTDLVVVDERTLSSTEVERARAVAESENWPAWEFGS